MENLRVSSAFFINDNIGRFQAQVVLRNAPTIIVIDYNRRLG